MTDTETNCPICKRDADDTMSDHHLVPKVKKGLEKVTLHRVCHDKIHSVFDNNELMNWYNTIELIMEREEMQKFAKFMKKKPANYTDPSIMSNKRNPNKRK